MSIVPTQASHHNRVSCRTLLAACAQQNPAMGTPSAKIRSGPAARNSRGATLLELMLALGLIGILSAIAIPAYGAYRQRADIARASADLRDLALRIQKYELNNLSFPRSLADVDANDWVDPWGQPYRFLSFEGLRGRSAVRKDGRLNPINSDYDLYSMGPDGKTAAPLRSKAGRDDIVRAGNGMFYGLAEDY